MKTATSGALVAAVGLAVASTPASAVVTTFATFTTPGNARDFSLVNSGNATGPSRATDAILYSTSTPTATQPGAASVRFSFLQPFLSDFVTNVTAAFTYNATIKRGTPAIQFGGFTFQDGIAGSFAFLSTSAITVTGPRFVPHTYAAGSTLLAGTFSDSTLFGASGATAASIDASSQNSIVTFTSDFLDFSHTNFREGAFSLTSLFPGLSSHSGFNRAVNSFRASASGQFASDPLPLINGLAAVPEPGTWMLMVAGLGFVGIAARRRAATVSG